MPFISVLVDPFSYLSAYYVFGQYIYVCVHFRKVVSEPW